MANALLNLPVVNNVNIEPKKKLEMGHTQIEADTMHSTIERCMRHKVINAPAEYISTCKSARKTPKQYDIRYLEHTFFKKFDDIMAYKSILLGVPQESIK